MRKCFFFPVMKVETTVEVIAEGVESAKSVLVPHRYHTCILDGRLKAFPHINRRVFLSVNGTT